MCGRLAGASHRLGGILEGWTERLAVWETITQLAPGLARTGVGDGPLPLIGDSG